MSDVKKCDACGVIYDEYGYNYEPPARKFKTIRAYNSGGSNGESLYYDACPACAMKLAKFFNLVCPAPNVEDYTLLSGFEEDEILKRNLNLKEEENNE